MARLEDVKGLDPHKVAAHTSWRIFELVYSTLVRLDSKLTVQPELAESWNVSNGDKTYTFSLRKGVKFHNGQELTSADVKYSFERILDEKTGAIARSLFTSIEKIDTPDPYIITFTLKSPAAAFLTNLANPNASIVSKGVVSGGDPAKRENVIGTGPYKLGDWVSDNYMVLDRNPDFFIKGQPVIQSIRFNVVPTEDGILAAMRSKNADFAFIEDPKVAKLARADKSLQLQAIPSLRYYMIFLNTKRKPFDDVRVRQALALAVDRQEIVNGAAFGEGTITGPFPPSLVPYSLPATQLFGYQRDLEKAKKLLAEAGYPNGFSFTMMTQTTGPANAPAIAQIVQEQLKKLNIDVKIELLEYAQWAERWRKADYDVAPGLNSGQPDPDYYYYRYFRTGESLNYITGYSNPEADRLLDTGAKSLDAEKRLAAYKDLQRVLANDVPFIWLYVGYEYYLMQPYVKNFTPLANAGVNYLREATIEK